MKNGFMDIHHHLLYGMDDGAKDQKMMQAMLRRAATEGITRIVATPHATPGLQRFEREKYAVAIREAAEFCVQEGLNLAVYEGAEILYTHQTTRFLQEGRIPTLAGTDRVLVEFSPDIPYRKLLDALEDLLHSGYLPVVAHVERYRCLAVFPHRAEKIKQEMDVFFQMNCRSVLVKGDFFQNRFVRRMLKKQLIDAIATDAHNLTTRKAQMKAAWRAVKHRCGMSYATRLTNGSLLYG